MAVDLFPTNDKGMHVGIQRPKLAVYEFYQGTGDHTENFPAGALMRELVFSNDSTTLGITIQVLGPNNLNITFNLLAYEVLDERLPEFYTVVITGPGVPWRFYTRSAQIS